MPFNFEEFKQEKKQKNKFNINNYFALKNILRFIDNLLVRKVYLNKNIFYFLNKFYIK